MSDALEAIRRPPREGAQAQGGLFDVEPEHIAGEHWWGLPEFSMEDVSPERRIVMNFTTRADVEEFKRLLGIRIGPKDDSAWFPPQYRLAGGEFVWRGTPSPTRYPVYIPSKGRADVETAGALLAQAGVTPWWIVEPQEADDYRAKYGDRVLILPFSNLGQGSIPARNWIWEHAAESGAKWHWIIDDNVSQLARTHMNRRIELRQSSAPLRVVEDFADRFDNLAFTGLAHKNNVQDRTATTPVLFNTRIYSFTLIRTDLPYRWRGRYNEDTDLCLRALKDGWATALIKTFCMDKCSTSNGAGAGGMKGGNTDNVYNSGDYRRAFADSLKEQHPDVTEVVWKFGRWHHQVDYSPFKRNDPQLRPDVTPTRHVDNYGLELVRIPRDGTNSEEGLDVPESTDDAPRTATEPPPCTPAEPDPEPLWETVDDLAQGALMSEPDRRDWL